MLGGHGAQKKTELSILNPAEKRYSQLDKEGLAIVYGYSIVYRPGTEMANTDSLSQLPLPEAPVSVPLPGETVLMETLYTSPISPAQLKKSTVRDPVLSHILEAARMGWHNLEGEEFQPINRKVEELSVQDCCLLWGSRLVIPKSMRQRVLEELHAGHPGVSCMKAVARLVARCRW